MPIQLVFANLFKTRPLTLVGCLLTLLFASNQPGTAAETVAPFLERFCYECHQGEDAEGGLNLATLPAPRMSGSNGRWERVVRKLRARQMPPLDATRPTEVEYQTILARLETELDRAAKENPQPGRTDTLRRLNRTEYRNAIRDLLAIDVDVSTMLPKDESSHGFDNVTVGELSPTLLNRYLSAARKISRIAIGRSGPAPAGDTFRVPADVTQQQHVEGLPPGTRGGTLIRYHFPQDGQYEVTVRLARDRNEEVEGLRREHRMEILLDRKPLESFVLRPPKDDDHSRIDAHLKMRMDVSAGQHQLGVTFVRQSASLLETKRQPYQASFNTHRHPRQAPAVFQVSITGPYQPRGPGDTASRRRIFIRRPTSHDDERACAQKILTALMRRAYRRPIDDADLARPMQLFFEARQTGDFEAGIELALSSVLVSPHFLFRIERQPADAKANEPYRISDVELASRLSFFLWSSIPDDELLTAAIDNRLHEPEQIRRQVLRMLADPRAETLSTNFASQWLHLRNLDSITPDLRQFPDFDENLRRSLRRETELLLLDVIRKDRSVLDLLKTRETFLNERLARHYGIPHVHGSRFRKVQLPAGSRRGGLLRHGSVLTVTSYATRTSPVLRGNWILENLVGAPPPPPPANVPALKDNTVAAELTVRQRLAAHRANPACASCHNLMDPVGFALENYDAVGRWRDLEAGQPIDATGGLPDGRRFTSVQGLERGLLARPELFVGTLTEKLLTYAVGRGVTDEDGPAVREIRRQARDQDYRFSTLIVGIANSTPFQWRMAQ